MTKAILGARILLGVAFLTFGLNYWLKFLSMPPASGLAGQFMGALFVSGFLALVKFLEIVGGAALLSKRFAPLGLVILGPILANILLYDIFLAKAFHPLGTLLLVLEVFLIWAYRKNFAGVFEAPKE
jgi:hypothetical protein